MRRMKRLTFEECKENCHDLWDWLAKTGKGKGDKWNWPEFDAKEYEFDDNSMFEGRMIPNACFACYYTMKDVEDEDSWDCRKCPITWGTEENEVTDYDATFCDCYPSPYHMWLYAKTVKIRKKYAAIIRDLLWVNKRKKG